MAVAANGALIFLARAGGKSKPALAGYNLHLILDKFPTSLKFLPVLIAPDVLALINGWVAMKTLISVAVLASVLTGLAVQPSFARAPLGFQLMCLQNPDQCKAGGPTSFTMTPQLLSELRQVNRHVNRSIRPRNDRGSDVWSLNVKVGDCEDYVLAKRNQLIAIGFPSSSLRIAYVRTQNGEDHAVLIIRSGSDNLTLDNLTNEIRPFSRTGHTLISTSGANPLNWD